MRKCLLLLPLLFLPLSGFAASDDTPLVEVFGGYSNLTANVSGSNFNLSGFDLSAQENLNSWFGGAAEFSSQFGKDNGIEVNTQSITYGPVFSYRKIKGFTPFAEAKLGAVRGGADYLNISKPEISFNAVAGGGIDIKVAPFLALRVIQADYYLTHFSNVRQDNVRVSAGIVILLGKKK